MPILYKNMHTAYSGDQPNVALIATAANGTTNGDRDMDAEGMPQWLQPLIAYGRENRQEHALKAFRQKAIAKHHKR